MSQRENRQGGGCKQHGELTGGVVLPAAVDGFETHVFTTPLSGNTLALANGSHLGERKVFKMEAVTASGTMVITPASFMDGTTITFDAATENAELLWDGGEWIIVGTPTATVA